MEDPIDCTICCETLDVGVGRIVCFRCNEVVCVPCQYKYARNDCAHCHLEFRRRYLGSVCGKVFYDTVVKPRIVSELVEKYKATIPYVLRVKEWKAACAKLKSLSRWGASAKLDKPKVVDVATIGAYYPCPKESCRGVVAIESNVCRLCLETFCPTCREPIKSVEGHTCNPATIENIRAISRECKNCPKCHTPIYRTEGCDHMNCTFCGIHFHFQTGQVLTRSTNHHYPNRFDQNRFQAFMASLRTETAGSVGSEEMLHTFSTDYCDASYRVDRISADLVEDKLTPRLEEVLYTVPHTVRDYCSQFGSEDALYGRKTVAFEGIMLRFVDGRIKTEERLGAELYATHMRFSLAYAYSGWLNMYLSMVDELQSQLRAATDVQGQEEEFIRNAATVIEFVNAQLTEVWNEYRGDIPGHAAPMRIKLPDEPDYIPYLTGVSV